MAKDKQSTKSPWIAWLAMAAIWLIGGAIQAVLWNHFEEDRTNQVMSVWIIFLTEVFCTLVWWTFFSGVRWVTRLAVWGGLFLCGLAALALLRFEGFSGGFWPRFSYRWVPTAEEKFLTAREAEKNYDGESPVVEDLDKPLEIRVGDWPQFRGPNGDGVIENAALRRNWDDGPPQAMWSKRVGPAWSSFAVMGDLVFTQMQIGPDECVVCFDLESGKEIWLHKNEDVRFEEFRMGVGPMATPTFYRGRIYALGATGVLNCLNPKTGEVFWSTNILKDAQSKNLEWGIAGSPVGYEDMILVNPGSNDEQPTAVAAYNWETGEKLWSGGQHPASYSTPVVATLDGQLQLLVFDGLGLAGHDLKNGSQLWHFEWPNAFKINVAKPILRKDDAVFISAGYSKGSALLRAEHDANNNWTVDTTDWETNSTFKLKFGDAVLKEEKLYALSEGILMCLDLDSGDILWKQRGDFGFGQLILVEDVLIILTETGEVVLVEIGGDHQELLRFPAIEGKSWSHPVFAHGRLLVRNAEQMACFDMRPAKAPSPTEPKPEKTAPPE